MRRFLSLFTILMLSGVLVFAQNRVVTGTITDNNGAPVSGASIRVKNSRIGTSADDNGNFTLKSVKTGSILVISGVGITAKEVELGSESVVKVNVVRTSAAELTAVIVTAAGIKRSEKTTGYAISKVDPNALLQKSEPDLLKGLQGKVAGVDIKSGQGTPGSATRIQIRGNSSFFGDNQPLIIVDGVPYSNDEVQTTGALSGGGAYGSGISDIDPNDIASMNILKGSSAGALYGSRASNGVIIITTKSGSASRTRRGTQLTLKSSLSFENIANLPEYQNSYGTGSQGIAGGGSNGSWGGHFGRGVIYDAGGGVIRPSSSGIDSVPVWAAYKAAFPDLFPNGYVAYRAYPNNVKDLFTTGVVTENSVNMNTGDEKSAFSLTASQLTHSGYVANNTYNRSNISLGGSTKLDIGLNVRGNFSYSRSVQNGGLFGENQNGSTSSQFGRSLFLGRSWDIDLPFEDKNGNSVSWVGSQADNPFWAAKYNKANTGEERIVAGAHLDYNLNKWARVDYNIGSNVVTLNRREIKEVSSRAGFGTLKVENYRNQEIESTFLLSLTPNVGNDFSFKSTLGTSFNQRSSSDLYGSGGLRSGGGGYIVRGIYTLQNFLPIDRSISDTKSERRLLGIFGDVTFGYKNLAFITVTGRNDISSTLPVNNRSYFYPSVSGSFIFSDALKLKGNVLDFGKLRAGYAKVGRDADPYNIYNTFGLGTAFLNQATGFVNSDANGGVALQPEFTKELELGTQLSFFKKIFELDFTYYDKRSTNLIAPVATASSTGYTSFYTNFGAISNKGIEIEATLRPITTKNFSWEIKGVFTKNKNIVTALADGLTHLELGGGTFADPSISFEVGKPYGFIYGTKTLRDSATGQLLIDPASGGMIADPDAKQIGNPNPDYKMGITNSFKYKGFFANVLFDMTKGGDLYSVTISSELGRGVTKDTEDRQTGWVIPGIYATQDPVTGKYLPVTVGGKTVPNQTRITTNDLYFSPNGGNTFAINTASEWNVYDATVYRLREITIGYELPKSLFKNSRVSGVTFSISGRNLWYLAPGFPKYTHFDPESGSFGSGSVQGLEYSAAPTTKRIGINLNVTF